MNSRPENGTERTPSSAFSGLFTMSTCSTTGSPAASVGQLVISTSSGRSTAIRRCAVRLSSVRTNDSSSSISWRLFVRATPMKLQNSRIADAG